MLDNFSPHLSAKKDHRAGEWAVANNGELACTPTSSSWLNRLDAQFQALRFFTLDGTDHASHREQVSLIRRYIIGATATHTTKHSATSSSAQTLPDKALVTRTGRTTWLWIAGNRVGHVVGSVRYRTLML